MNVPLLSTLGLLCFITFFRPTLNLTDLPICQNDELMLKDSP
jgi:hypothetical protein